MQPIFERLKKARVLVVGDVILDRYWAGESRRISPEAPVPVVNVEKVSNKLGGAGNVAANVASLGCFVSLLGYVGDDQEADLVEELLERSEIKSAVVRRKDRKTTVKLRIISRGQQLVRLDFEDLDDKFSKRSLQDIFEGIVDEHELVIFSDYRKGALADVERLIRIAKDAGKIVIVDPKGEDVSRYTCADLITPNLKEFESIAGRCKDEKEIRSKALEVIERHDIQNVLITKGALGMSLVTKDNSFAHIPAEAEDVFDVTGAGDTVCGVVGAMLAVGLPIREAISIANRAAGLTVRKLGAAVVKIEELDVLDSEDQCRDKLISVEALKLECEKIQQENGKIVLTNGCFDVLHVGHVRYLSEAKKLGDKLVVALNSDASVKEIKGEKRPINNLEARVGVLAALESVDWVVSFEDPTPIKVIKKLLPDFLVKGGDYEPSEIVGFEEVTAYGGEVKTLRYFERNSTTSLIERIEKL